MTTRIIKNKFDLDHLITYLANLKFPFTTNITKGLDRSVEQNSLAFKWYLEASQQGDQSAAEYRAYCKLHFGVPILRAENKDFKELYDKHFKGISYEDKLEIMQSEQFDFPVTRIMKTKQMKQYLDEVNNHFRGLGFILTEPKEKE